MMSDTIRMTMPNGQQSAITVETLSDGCIGLGFIRPGQLAQAVKPPRSIAKRLSAAIAKELEGHDAPPKGDTK